MKNEERIFKQDTGMERACDDTMIQQILDRIAGDPLARSVLAGALASCDPAEMQRAARLVGDRGIPAPRALELAQERAARLPSAPALRSGLGAIRRHGALCLQVVREGKTRDTARPPRC
jgi:hypothetical protein